MEKRSKKKRMKDEVENDTGREYEEYDNMSVEEGKKVHLYRFPSNHLSSTKSFLCTPRHTPPHNVESQSHQLKHIDKGVRLPAPNE
ncbi:hypothetical protein E2C01_008144 [Portunus trituberculatus]|uniref:Uncharacterized protein n=1 Tax=Portunus trituberculatus TaxID=210409 RepID=A0A5B7D014_PORTR|nr:hypothetical protein [Portunus trituberculatus]